MWSAHHCIIRRRSGSPLGELMWYLSASNALDFIQYYIPQYPEFSDDGCTLNGAYPTRKIAQFHGRLTRRLLGAAAMAASLRIGGHLVVRHWDESGRCLNQK